MKDRKLTIGRKAKMLHDYSETSVLKETLAPSSRLNSDRKALLFLALLSIAVASLVLAPFAHAVIFKYANDVATSENQYHYSGTVSSISGGTASVEPFSADGAGTEIYIETYYPPPGASTVMVAKGGSAVEMSHPRSASASQKCRWDWPWAGGDIGSLKLTCSTQ